MTGGEADKCHPVAVLGVHIGLNLEHKAGDRGFRRVDLAFGGLLRLRLGSIFAHAVHQFLHTERVDRRTEPDRGHRTVQERLPVERRQQFAGHFNLFAELPQKVGGDMKGEFGVVHPRDLQALRDLVAVGTVHDFEAVVQQIIGADEIAANPDRPRGGCYVNREVFLNLVDDLEHIAAFAVHLVAKGQDRQVAQAADLEQLAGLGFDPLGPVDHHDGGVNGGQGPVGIFREIAVAGGVDQVEAPLTIVVGHGGGRDGNPALLLQFHEVRPCAPGFALGADLARHLDRPAEQQELLGERGLAGVGVRDDRKGPTPPNFRGDDF